MAIFAKKPEWDQKHSTEVGGTTAAPPAAAPPKGGYGIGEAIQLMRSLPVDQHPDLVVRVVRATLGSLNVHLPDIIEDASKKQKTVQDRIAAVHGQIGELEKQLEAHKRDIAALEADLKETTSVKERLQMAEKLAGAAGPGPATSSPGAPAHPTPPVGSTTIMGMSSPTATKPS
jgi:hypothetical protein